MGTTEQPSSSQASVARAAIGYTAMVVLTVVAFFWVRSYGETLSAPDPLVERLTGVKGARADLLARILFALAAVIVVGQLLARLFKRIDQPPVIGEVVAGILLGPSLLGHDFSQKILPTEIAPALGIIAQFGVILYMFVIGLELDPKRIKGRVHSTVATSHASILAPFLLGAILALWLYPRYSSSDVSFTSFALFLGVAMSITAFPVLARILSDRKLARTELGVIALSCAATDDVTAWCLLALVVGVAKAEVDSGFFVAIGAVAYIGLMIFLARPLLRRYLSSTHEGGVPRGLIVATFIALLFSTMATELIGIHAIFGAFLLGVIIPHDSSLAHTLTRQLESVVTILFLPAFFAYTGMRTRIDLVDSSTDWLVCALIIFVATLGKFGGSYVAARLTGIQPRMAAALGALMNTRGLMELIVLNVGLDLQVISPKIFSMMVIMALVTTIMTGPALKLFLRDRAGEEHAAAARAP
ncbi:MAG: cation:proton antiporter [Planctomycetota bacterium]